jgi:hypothetical protein
MNTTALIASLERLAIKQGAALGNLHRCDWQLVLALAARCLPAAAVWREPAVNEALKCWLATTGAMLRVDHVELRRTLIDAGLWQRDGFGHAYERAAALVDASLAAQGALLDQVNPEQIVHGARERHAAARAQRKAASAGTPWLTGTPPSPAPPRP